MNEPNTNPLSTDLLWSMAEKRDGPTMPDIVELVKALISEKQELEKEVDNLKLEVDALKRKLKLP